MNSPNAITETKTLLLGRALRIHGACTALVAVVCAWSGAHLLTGLALGAALGAANLWVVAWAAARLVGRQRPGRVVAQGLLAIKLGATCAIVAAVLVWLQPSAAGVVLGWTSALVALGLAAMPAHDSAGGSGAALSAM
ncbi:MAG: ATP synthase subunit I [Deltaproteobacteria bacterium]|nr:ATP synthase subunit I [Deltaproteobacteria bacterium]